MPLGYQLPRMVSAHAANEARTGKRNRVARIRRQEIIKHLVKVYVAQWAGEKPWANASSPSLRKTRSYRVVARWGKKSQACWEGESSEPAAHLLTSIRGTRVAPTF